MHRRRMCILTTAASIAATSGLAGAQGARDVEIETIKVSGNVYMLIGQGGNIGVCTGEDGTFMIDDQFAPLTGKILAAVGKITDRRVEFLINTHHHGDHTGGNENFAGEGTNIVAHENVRARLKAAGDSASTAGLPVITFPDEMTFHWNGDDIHVFHMPHAHTDGDSIIHFKSANVFHMGDTFFNGMYPFIDVGSGGDVDGLIAVADKVLTMVDENTKIIPGHGDLTDADGLRDYRDMLQDVRGRVAALIAEGKTKEEVVAANPSAKYDKALGGSSFMPPERFVGLMYESLKD